MQVPGCRASVKFTKPCTTLAGNFGPTLSNTDPKLSNSGWALSNVEQMFYNTD